MSHSQFHSIEVFILRHAWLNLWDKRMLLAESTRLLSRLVVRLELVSHNNGTSRQLVNKHKSTGTFTITYITQRKYKHTQSHWLPNCNRGETEISQHWLNEIQSHTLSCHILHLSQRQEDDLMLTDYNSTELLHWRNDIDWNFIIAWRNHFLSTQHTLAWSSHSL